MRDARHAEAARPKPTTVNRRAPDKTLTPVSQHQGAMAGAPGRNAVVAARRGSRGHDSTLPWRARPTIHTHHRQAPMAHTSSSAPRHARGRHSRPPTPATTRRRRPAPAGGTGRRPAPRFTDIAWTRPQTRWTRTATMDARRLPPRPGACVSSGTHHGALATRSPRMSSPVNRSASGRRVKFSTTKASKKGARLHMETGLSGNRTRDRSE